jgi:NADPH-dependent 2,4-dienoyl-CoA reductase/sulfur reductase-like enzyme
LRTSDPAIHAIGDIASVPDPRLGHPIRVEHWVVAQRMGQWLARHLLGMAEGAYQDVPFFWSGHYDLSLRYFAENGEEQAILTAGRDVLALEKEHRWEAAKSDADG